MGSDVMGSEHEGFGLRLWRGVVAASRALMMLLVLWAVLLGIGAVAGVLPPVGGAFFADAGHAEPNDSAASVNGSAEPSPGAEPSPEAMASDQAAVPPEDVPEPEATPTPPEEASQQAEVSPEPAAPEGSPAEAIPAEAIPAELARGSGQSAQVAPERSLRPGGRHVLPEGRTPEIQLQRWASEAPARRYSVCPSGERAALGAGVWGGEGVWMVSCISSLRILALRGGVPVEVASYDAGPGNALSRATLGNLIGDAAPELIVSRHRLAGYRIDGGSTLMFPADPSAENGGPLAVGAGRLLVSAPLAHLGWTVDGKLLGSHPEGSGRWMWTPGDSPSRDSRLGRLDASAGQASADFDRDGTPDLLVLNRGELALYPGGRPPRRQVSVVDGRELVTVDIDGDGNPEALVRTMDAMLEVDASGSTLTTTPIANGPRSPRRALALPWWRGAAAVLVLTGHGVELLEGSEFVSRRVLRMPANLSGRDIAVVGDRIGVLVRAARGWEVIFAPLEGGEIDEASAPEAVERLPEAVTLAVR